MSIPLWVAIAFSAGTFQTARNALARSLSGRISPALNSWSRFAFNLPFSTALLGLLLFLEGVPRTSPVFFAWCLGTGVTQLVANVALVAAFRRANFAQSIVLHKLEIAFTAVIGVLLFAEFPSPFGWAGVGVCTLGVLLRNLGREAGPAGWRRAFHIDSGGALALACALLLVFASFFLKEATTEFAALNPRVGTGRFEAAAHTLFHTTWMEVVILSAWLVLFQPGELRQVGSHWRRMLAIGTTGFSGSLCPYGPRSAREGFPLSWPCTSLQSRPRSV